MNKNDYLQKILEEQTFESTDQELKDLRQRRKEIEKLLLEKFAGSTISIRWGGAMAKGTMIRESYDGDMTCYFENDDTAAGDSLVDIFDNVATALEVEYMVQRKTSAIRVKEKSSPNRGKDIHIDVVPGRYTDDTKTDVFIHQNGGTKDRLKTNLNVHIDHIKGSGVADVIRLMKLWNVRNGIGVKTFVLELLTVKLLESKKSNSLSGQLEHVWSEFRDNAENLAVEDPANPNGNDLKPALDACRWSLSSIARTTIANIESQGWESVFGPLKDEQESQESKTATIHVAVAHAAVPTRPWCGEA
jgi:hypothetical protein